MSRVAIPLRMTYAAYIGSDLWRERRALRLEKDGHRCQGCGSTEDLHVHHKTYERLGCELPDDTVTVCEDCHGFIHREHKRTRRRPLAEVTDAVLAQIKVSGKTQPAGWVDRPHIPRHMRVKRSDWRQDARNGGTWVRKQGARATAPVPPHTEGLPPEIPVTDYAAYLASPAWAARRKREFARAQGKCLGCGRRADHVHHRSYARLGYEAPGDLVALCEDCHTLAHLRHVEDADHGLWVATNAVITEQRILFGLPPVSLPTEKSVSVATKAVRRTAKQRQRAARWAERHKVRTDAFFASGRPPISAAEIEAGKSAAGGWSRKQLAAWGVPWPPPKGWKDHLMAEKQGKES